MSTFRYEAISKDGVRVRGVVKARDKNEAVIQLKDELSIVTSIKETYDYAGIREKLNATSGKINAKTLSLVCQQFGIMLDAGIPVGTAVTLLQKQTKDRTFKKILADVAEDVTAGYSMADSFQIHGKKLPATFIETIRSGEESGALAEAFTRLSDFYMTRHKLYSKIKRAFMYPIFVIALAFVVIAIVMIKAIPTIAQTFMDQGENLPGLTLWLINTSNFFRKWFWLMAIIIAILIILFISYAKTRNGALRISKIRLKLPIIGKIEKLNIASQFSATMSTMLISGLPLMRALTITGNTLTNRVVSESIERAVKNLEAGFSLGDCLKKEGTLDELLVEMCTMGEQSGSLESTLSAIGKYYDYETEQAASRALGIIEPAILIILGIFVAIIVIALYLPMFTMYNGM